MSVIFRSSGCRPFVSRSRRFLSSIRRARRMSCLITANARYFSSTCQRSAQLVVWMFFSECFMLQCDTAVVKCEKQTPHGRPLLKHSVPKLKEMWLFTWTHKLAGAQQRKGRVFIFHFLFSGRCVWKALATAMPKEFISRRSRPNSENLFFLFSFFIIPLSSHLPFPLPLRWLFSLHLASFFLLGSRTYLGVRWRCPPPALQLLLMPVLL